MATIEISEEYFVPPHVMYDAFTNDTYMKRIARGADTKLEAKRDGAISLFGGTITGRFLELDPPNHIKMLIHFDTWEDSAESVVTIEFQPIDGDSTIVKFKQTNIPSHDKFGQAGCKDNCTIGWKVNVFERIEKILGYARRSM